MPKSLYALMYYPDAATEMLSLALEYRLPDPDVVGVEPPDPNDPGQRPPARNVNWDLAPGNGNFDPEYVAMVLGALRPNRMRQLGIKVPMLL
jgi:hypothetical protein